MVSKLKSFFDKKLDDFLNTSKVDYLKLKESSSLLNFSSSNMSNSYYRYMGDDKNVIDKISDLVLMYDDPIIFNALEMFVDDASTYSPITQKRVWSVMKNKRLQKMADDLFNDLNIDEKCWEHLIRLGMYGNCPIAIHYKNDDFSGGINNIAVEEDLFRYIPIEINGQLIKFVDKYSDKLLEPFEVEFGRINIVGKYNITNKFYTVSHVTGLNKDEVDIKYTFKYGTSLFENSRRVWKQLRLLENNMILTRQDRTPVVRIFKVRTDGLYSNEASDMIEFYSDLLATENRRISIDDNLIKGEYGQVGFGINIMLPVEQKGDIEVDEFGGNADVVHIVDVEYFENKFYASLKTPLEYLGMERDRGLSIGDNSLQRKEIQYARRVKKLQFAALKMYKNLLFYHFLSLKEDVSYDDINVMMNIVSTAEDEEFKSALETSMTNVESFVELMNNIKEFLINNNVNDKSRDYLLDYLTQKILNSNDFNWKQFFTDLLKDQNENKPEFESDNFTVEEKKVIKRQLREDIFPNLFKYMSKLSYKKNIPNFPCDKNLRYCEKVLRNRNSFNLKLLKEEKLNILDIKEHINNISVFDISLYGLKHEKLNLDFSNFIVEDKKVIKNIDNSNIYFSENIFDIKDIMSQPYNSNIVLYEKNKKFYCNYLNGNKFFKNYIDGVDINFEIYRLIDKS